LGSRLQVSILELIKNGQETYHICKHYRTAASYQSRYNRVVGDRSPRGVFQSPRHAEQEFKVRPSKAGVRYFPPASDRGILDEEGETAQLAL